jgi:hypothetical protein
LDDTDRIGGRLSIYAKIALGLCALGASLIAGMIIALTWAGSENVGSEVSSSSGSVERTASVETTREIGEDASEADEKAVNSEPVALPDYEILDESYAERLRQIEVQTEASGEQQMRLIAEDLRAYTPRDGILLLDFNRENGPSEGTGFAMLFDSRAAAADPSLSYTEEEEEAIFEEDGGIRVVSFKEAEERDPNLVEQAEGLLANL